MAKLAPTSIKYIIKARISAKGVIEKPDVIGAVFGQTEGLLGNDLDLRELQGSGKIGRIEVNITSKEGNSEGEISIPSALDAAETALIAATLETIERVGPCTATIILERVEDTRSDKRKYVVDKAKDILKGLMDSAEEDISEISEDIKASVRTHEITTYKGLPAGSNMEESEDILIVEGRADILTLLRYGIRNTIALEGTSIPQAVVDLTKEKTTTLFVDGDRGGQLIAKELFQRGDVDFVATAPDGKEVEDLSKKELLKSLRNKLPADQYQKNLYNQKSEGSFARKRDREKKPRKIQLSEEEKALFKKTLDDLVGTRAAYIFNAKHEVLGKVPISELASALKTTENPHTIVFDGTVDYLLNSLARKRGIKCLVGMEKEDIHTPINVLSREDLDSE